MRYTNEFDSDKENIDIYSATQYEDISSSSKPLNPKRRKRKNKKKSKTIIISMICLIMSGVILIAGCLGLFVGTTVFDGLLASILGRYVLNEVERVPLETTEPHELHITTSDYANVKNIALLGIDSREDNTSGRSDAVLILSIDKEHNKIKLISIARDTCVEIDGHGQDKLTHAYAYGKSTLAVKTLNKNFDLEITDYATVNFYELSRIIDYIGGVTIDVNQKEREHLNSYVIPKLRKQTSLECKDIPKTGKQVLDGTQALCYARIRKIDGDIERGNRQKEVLTAMIEKFKKTSVSKLPNVVKMVLSECTTSLSDKTIIDMGKWALLSQPEIEHISIPNDNIDAKGGIRNGKWYYLYDLNVAKEEMKKFILEK